MAVELHRDRVDEERHVVVDDLDDGVASTSQPRGPAAVSTSGAKTRTVATPRGRYCAAAQCDSRTMASSESGERCARSACRHLCEVRRTRRTPRTPWAPEDATSGTIPRAPVDTVPPVANDDRCRTAPRARARTGRRGRRDHDRALSIPRPRTWRRSPTSRRSARPTAPSNRRSGSRIARRDRTRDRSARSSATIAATADAEYRWIIDPIDGTKNYVRGVPIWATLIGLEHAGELVVGRRLGTRARNAVVGGPRCWARSATAIAIRVSSVASIEDAHVGFAWDNPARFDARRHRRRLFAPRASLLAHARRRRLLAAHARRRRRVRHLGRPDRVALGRRRARPDRRGGGRSVEHRSTAAPTPTGGSFVCTNGVLHDTVTSMLRDAIDRPAASSVAAMSERHRRYRHRDVVGEGGRRRRRRQRRRAGAHPARLPRAEPVAVRARRGGSRGIAARSARSRRSATCEPRAVSVAAMVPSLTAVDDAGVPCAPGLLYGDERGHQQRCGAAVRAGRARAVPALARRRAARRARLLDGAGRREPRAHRRVPSSRRPSRRPPMPLFDCERVGRGARRGDAARVSSSCPSSASRGQPLGEVDGYADCVLEGGTIDAMAEQIVAGADEPGDVLVILGTTLIVWAVVPDLVDVARTTRDAAHRTGGVWLVGGPSNAGGLVPRLGRAAPRRGTGPSGGHDAVRPDERAGLGAVPARRTGAAQRPDAARPARRPRPHARRRAIRRAAFEASGFVTRRMIEASPVPARRIVATGGGTRRRRVGRGARRLHRPARPRRAQFPKAARSARRSSRGMAAGLETNAADGSRWARDRSGRRARPGVGSARRSAVRAVPRGLAR